jgi:hypothetical protein
MNYIYFLTYLFFAWLSGASAFAQTRLMYGPKAGINYAGWDHENYNIIDTRDFYQKVPGFTVGAVARYRLHGRWHLTAELLYGYSGSRQRNVTRGTSQLVVGRFPYESQRNHVQVLGGAGISINGQWLIGLQYSINPKGYGYLYREAAVSSVPDPRLCGCDDPGGISYHDRAFTLSVAFSPASRKAL